MSLTVFKTSVSSALLHTLGVVNECKFTKGELLYNALDKLKALCFDGLDEDMETSRDVFLFACCTGAAYCDLMSLNCEHLIRDDEGALWLKFNRQKTGVLCRVKLLPEALRLLEQLHNDARETLLPYEIVAWSFVWSLLLCVRMFLTLCSSNPTVKQVCLQSLPPPPPVSCKSTPKCVVTV